MPDENKKTEEEQSGASKKSGSSNRVFDEDDDGFGPADDEDDSEDLDGDDELEEDEAPFYKTKKGLILIGVGVVIVGIILYLTVFKEDLPPPPPPTEEVEAPVNKTQVIKEGLYQIGIGKDALSEINIYEQGPLESDDFRKDFVNNDAPENYVMPIEIVAVNDSVSYTKHRTMTDDGMDMYWAEAVYKGKKTRFTVPYYIWRTLASQGVMDVVTEVVTDANGNTFITSITAVPPNGGK